MATAKGISDAVAMTTSGRNGADVATEAHLNTVAMTASPGESKTNSVSNHITLFYNHLLSFIIIIHFRFDCLFL